MKNRKIRVRLARVSVSNEGKASARAGIRHGRPSLANRDIQDVCGEDPECPDARLNCVCNDTFGFRATISVAREDMRMSAGQQKKTPDSTVIEVQCQESIRFY